MRTLFCILSLLFVAFTASAEHPDAEHPDAELPDTEHPDAERPDAEHRDAVRSEGDSTAMSILDSYRHLLPPHEFDRGSWRIRTWHPKHGVMPLRLPDARRVLFFESDMSPRVKVAVPRFVDYGSITLRFGDGGSSLTISNGSAYNYMPWPHAPQGYRDARTLSFPVPR